MCFKIRERGDFFSHLKLFFFSQQLLPRVKISPISLFIQQELLKRVLSLVQTTRSISETLYKTITGVGFESVERWRKVGRKT